MKTSLFLFVGMLIGAIAFGQNWKMNAIPVTSPTFKTNHQNSIDDFLKKNVEYPSNTIGMNRQGVEVVQFVVTEKGTLTDFKVINSVSYEIDQEIIHHLKLTSGKWTAGTKDGVPVAMKKEISMVFKLYASEDFSEMAKRKLQKGNDFLFEKNNPEKALKYYDEAINLSPNDETLHAMRGICKYKLGNKTGATADWDRSNMLALRNGNTFDFGKLAIKSIDEKDVNHMMFSFDK